MEMMQTVTEQCVVALTWTLKDTLGEELDVLDEPVEFLVGGDDLLPKISEALQGFSAGDKVDLHLEPEHVLLGGGETVLQHLGNLVVAQAVRRLDVDSGLDAAALLLGADAEQAIGIDGKHHADTRRARHHGGNRKPTFGCKTHSKLLLCRLETTKPAPA